MRPYNLIKGLAQLGHAVTLLALASTDELGDGAALETYCQGVECVPLSAREVAPSVLSAALTGKPLQAAFSRSSRMAEIIRRQLREERFDLVHIEHLRASALGMSVQGLPKIYDSVDCISLLWERAARSSPEWRTRLLARLELPRTRRYEGEIIQQYDRVLATSAEDRDALLSLARARSERAHPDVRVLPNGVDLDYFAPLDVVGESDTLVFTGKMSYHANIAAVLHLCQEIMPLIWRERPQVRLQIVGKGPPASVVALAQDERIEVTGYVPDLRPYLARATVAVSPIRYGVGIQNKVLEPMAMGRPVVTDSQVSRALKAEAGRDLLMADTPTDFASCVLRLLDDRELRASLSANARRYVEKHHDWLSIAEDLVRIYQETL